MRENNIDSMLLCDERIFFKDNELFTLTELHGNNFSQKKKKRKKNNFQRNKHFAHMQSFNLMRFKIR